MSDPYIDWCEDNKTTHGHCPKYPQPILLKNDKLVCGKCFVYFNEQMKWFLVHQRTVKSNLIG